MKTWQWGLGLLVAASIGIAILHPRVFFSPNAYLFDRDGDGLKNYYTLAYHVAHDSSAWQFEGMNYPYGENILYVDCQPLLANVLRYIHQTIFPIAPYSVGLLNLLMLFSVPFAALFLFLLLREYGLPPLLSATGGLSIALLSSQVLLWEYGHYGLSYPCFFPMGWYLLFRYEQSRSKTGYSLLVGLNTFGWFFIHTYPGLMLLGFTAIYHLVRGLAGTRNRKSLWTRLSAFFVQVILPGGVYYLLMILTDTHPGRIDMPYTPAYRASVYSVFLPNYSYLRPLFDTVMDLSPQDRQSWARVGNYIGLPSLLIGLGFLFYGLTRLSRRKKPVIPWPKAERDGAFLLAAVLLLLYAMAFPFRFHDMHQYLPASLKQFTGLGRFAWPFYYVSTVLSTVFLWRVTRWRTLVLAAALITGSEGVSCHLHLAPRISRHANALSEEGLRQNGIRDLAEAYPADGFQALLPLPFYHGYITQHRFATTQEGIALAMQLSYACGLPQMAAKLSRPSMLDAMHIKQFFAPPFYPKPVLDHLNGKPLLVFANGQPLSSAGERVWSRCHPFYQQDSITLAGLRPTRMGQLDTQSILANYHALRDTGYLSGTHKFYTDLDFMPIYESFDERKSDRIFRGGGALQLKKDTIHRIFSSHSYRLDTGRYVLSFWYYNHLYDQTFNSFRLEHFDARDSLMRTQKFPNPIKSNRYVGFWGFEEASFQIRTAGDYTELVSEGQSPFDPWFYVDELLVRKQRQEVFRGEYSQADSTLVGLWRNNEYIPLSKESH